MGVGEQRDWRKNKEQQLDRRQDWKEIWLQGTPQGCRQKALQLLGKDSPKKLERKSTWQPNPGAGVLSGCSQGPDTRKGNCKSLPILTLLLQTLTLGTPVAKI